MAVTFDASSSSAEGFNSAIISYEWKIDDPYNMTHITISSPITSHAFQYGGTYVVTLNVTDDQGLWSTTAKPVIVSAEFGPTANFTWDPTIPSINLTVQFDASVSTPGWSAQISDFSPIVSYTWNFGDGTPVTPIPDPTMGHNFTKAGNYPVQLTVMDSVGRTNTTQVTVEVMNLQYPIWDINQDGKCNILDVSAVAKLFGQNVPPAPAYADIAGPHGVPDGKVNILDVSLVSKHFGETYI
jgi:PKD repeat protein